MAKAPQSWPIFIIPRDVQSGDFLMVIEFAGSVTGAIVSGALLKLDCPIGILEGDGSIRLVGVGTRFVPLKIRGELKGSSVQISF